MKQIINISLAMVGTLVMTTQSAVSEALTELELHATLGIVTNFILDDGISHHGKTYGKVTSPYTGRVWLDRNLGASKVCTALDDTACYGDYYQWGRNHDGHQEINSTITSVKAIDVTNAGTEFITSNAANNFDWASLDASGSIRTANWFEEGVDAVCPTGYRVPTIDELHAELLNPTAAGIANNLDAFNSFLKLPAAGVRTYFGALSSEGTKGYLWSLTDNGSRASSLYYTNIIAETNDLITRASGRSVRCIEKLRPEKFYYHNGTVYGTVTSPYTGKVWLDRNLGASRVCTALDDVECYGDYYQWGRAHDGHEDNASATTGTPATDVNNVGHENFILTSSTEEWTFLDSDGSIRTANWSKTDGSSVCPVGFRVPNITELEAELLDADPAVIESNSDVFTGFLKFPSAGSRNYFSGSVNVAGNSAYIWSSSISPINPTFASFGLVFLSAGEVSGMETRSAGRSIRCLKD